MSMTKINKPEKRAKTMRISGIDMGGFFEHNGIVFVRLLWGAGQKVLCLDYDLRSMCNLDASTEVTPLFATIDLSYTKE